MKTMGTMVLAMALAAPALAQQRVEERRPAAPDGTVEIDCPTGAVRVIGWDKNEVQVTGTLARDAGPLKIDASERRVKIEVEMANHPEKSRGELEIRVPSKSRLRVESFAGAITVSDVTGDIRAESVQGGIVVTGATGEINAETVNGGVEITGPSRYVRAEAVNGAVTLRGGSGELSASAVSGAVTVSGGSFKRVKLESVSGPVRFEGGIEKGGEMGVESVSGKVDVLLPADQGADIEISSFAGDIRYEFNAMTLGRGEAATPSTGGRHGEHEKERRLTIGGGGARVSIETMSGSVLVRSK
jgi:DUF4097 and DUF4098 domain-containing protein YvlB